MTQTPIDTTARWSTAAPGAPASTCRSSRSATGTTSATTANSRPNGRSPGEPSTSASPTTTSPTTTAPPYGAAEINFGRLMREDFRPYRDEMVTRPRRGWDMWPGPYGQGGRRAQVRPLLARPVARPHGPRLRRHLLLAPARWLDPTGGDDGRARHRRAPGQGALRSASPPTTPTTPGAPPRSSRTSARRSSSTSRATRC